MLTHGQIWAAIDKLAERHGMSASALARKAGLDPTAFNPSKRHGPEGRERWPTTESIAKILAATGSTVEVFFGLVAASSKRGAAAAARATIPLIGFAQAGKGGFFDDAGFPVGAAWEEVSSPGVSDVNAYALKITGDSMLPVYRQGDVIIVSPNASLRRGDRVVAKTRSGEVMAKILQRQTSKTIELASFNPDHDTKILPAGEVLWLARILWASQ